MLIYSFNNTVFDVDCLAILQKSKDQKYSKIDTSGEVFQIQDCSHHTKKTALSVIQWLVLMFINSYGGFNYHRK